MLFGAVLPFYATPWCSGVVQLCQHARRKRLLCRRDLVAVLPRYRRAAPVNLLEPFQLAINMTMRLTELSVYAIPLWCHIVLFKATNDPDHINNAIVSFIARSGGAFIKAGQWAATRPDIFPAPLCHLLSRLHDDAPHHGPGDTEKAVRRHAALHDLQVGDMIGSGTVGQVHAGRWRGRPVAVKVLHPGIHGRLDIDLRLMHLLVSVVDPLVGQPWIELREELRQFDTMMRQQLDLRHEGRTLRRFANNFRYSLLPVRFPGVLYAAEDVLVEELEWDGVRMTDFMAHCRNGGLMERVAVCGVRAFVKMMLWDNFVHADLHPGNMMVRVVDSEDGSVVTDTRLIHPDRHYTFSLIFLDTGLVTELGRRDHQNFTLLFKALIVDGDGEQAGRLIATRIPQPYMIDADGFSRRIGHIAAPILSARFALSAAVGGNGNGALQLGPILVQVMEAVREHRVRLDPAFTNLMWSVVCVEGVGRRLAPQLPLQPVILQAAVQFIVSEAVRAATV